uniref:MoaB/Mog domain-containing protein n=1 Tax=Panagrolaimus sp. PS1159 TaxID=55785 RepID=A0AC35FPQ5_9BILA
MSSSESTIKRKTAGIIVIGDEILKGSTADTNSNFLCRRLHNRGVCVKKISVVGDEVAEIAREIAEFSSAYDIVLSTGGVGPTHDDRTYEGIAAAFNDTLLLNMELKAVFEDVLAKYKQRPDAEEAISKFCSIPTSSTLIWGDKKQGARKFPCVQTRNVVALPGVPSFCQQGFDQLESILLPSNDTTPFFSKNIFLSKNEIHIQHSLGEVAKRYEEDGVTIGSYPVVGNSYYKTKLTVEAPTDSCGNSVFNELSEVFQSFIKNFDEMPWVDTVTKMKEFKKTLETEFAKKLEDAENLIDEILKKFSYDEIALSFNGGKDCTLLLHLLRTKIDDIYGPETRIKAFHILCEDEFSELRHFLLDVCWKYNVQLRELGGSLKVGLTELKEVEPKVKAVFMGSRASDPKGKYMSSKCQWTDSNWPQFYRVCPIFDWSYSEVWKGLRGLCIPYCILYDRGYTSLGDRSKTKPNPALAVSDGGYKPAYCLEQDSLERCGRDEEPLVTHKL